MLFLVDTGTAGAIGRLCLLQTDVIILHVRLVGSVEFFLEHGLRLDGFEFGLEIRDGMTMRAAIGATTGIGEVVAIILPLLARGAPKAQCISPGPALRSAGQNLPVALASSFLLDLLRVSVDVAGLGKVAGKVVLGDSSTVGKGDMVTVILLV